MGAQLYNRPDLAKYTKIIIKILRIVDLINLCLTIYFQFDQQICQQVRETCMGSPSSEFIAEITMQNLETIVPATKSLDPLCRQYLCHNNKCVMAIGKTWEDKVKRCRLENRKDSVAHSWIVGGTRGWERTLSNFLGGKGDGRIVLSGLRDSVSVVLPWSRNSLFGCTSCLIYLGRLTKKND